MSAALAIAVERQVDAIIAARARASGEGPRGVSTFRA
jgi:hypothetical protein